MIDWARVDELRDEVGADDFVEVVDLFLEEVDEVMTRLCSTPDPTRYESDLHFLKGSALTLGFMALSTVCGEGERAAAEGNVDSVDIGAVIDSYKASRAEFLAQLGLADAA